MSVTFSEGVRLAESLRGSVWLQSAKPPTRREYQTAHARTARRRRGFKGKWQRRPSLDGLVGKDYHREHMRLWRKGKK